MEFRAMITHSGGSRMGSPGSLWCQTGNKPSSCLPPDLEMQSADFAAKTLHRCGHTLRGKDSPLRYPDDFTTTGTSWAIRVPRFFLGRCIFSSGRQKRAISGKGNIAVLGYFTKPSLRFHRRTRPLAKNLSPWPFNSSGPGRGSSKPQPRGLYNFLQGIRNGTIALYGSMLSGNIGEVFE